MGRFTVIIKSVEGGNRSWTANAVSLELGDDQGEWGEKFQLSDERQVPDSPPSFDGSFPGDPEIGFISPQVGIFDVGGSDHLPTKLRISIGAGHDQIAVHWVAIIREPARGEDLSVESVNIFDWGPKGISLSSDHNEGVSDAEIGATDMSATTGVFADYLIMVQTGKEGMNGQAFVTLFGIDGKPIGTEFEITQTLHDTYGDAASYNSIQAASFLVPKPGWTRGQENPPTPVFLKLRVNTSDEWKVERIWVVSRKSGKGALERTTLSRFEYDAMFSTDSTEGKTELEATAQGFGPTENGSPKKNYSTTRTYAIANASELSSGTDPVSVELDRGFTQTISLSQETGDKNSNSIKFGFEFGYNPPSTSGGANFKASVNYSHTWESWNKKIGVKLYTTTSGDKEKADFHADGNTIRLGEWSLTHETETISVSNGFGDPVSINLIPAQSLEVPSPTEVEISDTNKISRKDWSEWKKNLLAIGTAHAHDVATAEKDIEKHGWFLD